MPGKTLTQVKNFYQNYKVKVTLRTAFFFCLSFHACHAGPAAACCTMTLLHGLAHSMLRVRRAFSSCPLCMGGEFALFGA